MIQPYKILTKPKKWHSLTEIPKQDEVSVINNTIVKPSTDSKDLSNQQPPNALLIGVSAVLIKLLWDILVYPYSSVSVRIKRLGISARAYEHAKHEGLEKEFFIESSAGQTKYLIPTLKTFETFNMPCHYESNKFIEHGFYKGWGRFMLGQDPRNKSVHLEVKVGNKGSASDIVTVTHDGTRQAWEITLTTTNILSNASKYENTDFARINFLCRDYKLKQAVKACCRESGLNPDLLARLEYMHFSQLLQRQRKLSLYR